MQTLDTIDRVALMSNKKIEWGKEIAQTGSEIADARKSRRHPRYWVAGSLCSEAL